MVIIMIAYDEYEIINEVKKLRQSYSLNNIPVDLNVILKAEDIKTIVTDFTEYENKVKKPISGMLYIDGDRKYILINEKDNKKRQNFTIAHELGHYFLHGGKDATNEVFVSFRGDSNQRETEANRFAAELLLPDEDVEKEYKLVIYPTVSYLAEKFNVSRQAMGIKLEQLGLNYIGL